MAKPADAKEYARPRVEASGFDWPTYERQIQQESGWEHWRSDGSVKASPSGSMGLGQLNSRFYPESDWRDPYTNLAKSIEVVSGYLRRFGSYRYALAAYNFGPGNVGGYTKADGTVVPPWDGRRETISDQGRRYLDVILGPGWPEPGSVSAPSNEGPKQEPPAAVVYEDIRTPHVGGRFSGTPKGIILHGSRSGVAGRPKDVEYRGCASWAINNPDGLSWHATIGENRVAVHLTPQEWGWNARAASSHYLAVEIAQATVDEAVTDAQVTALADWIRTRVLPAYPSLPMHFPSHAEVEVSGETGQRDGKTDIWPAGDRRTNELRARLLAALGTAPLRSEDVTKEEAAALRAENARLQETVNGLVTAIAVIADDGGDAIDAQVKKIKAIREQFLGARPA